MILFDLSSDTFVNTKKQANIKFATGSLMEFDIWIPELNVCFEFQVLQREREKKRIE